MAQNIPISPYKISNGTIYLSGQLAFDENGHLVGDDISEQTSVTLRNIESVINS